MTERKTGVGIYHPDTLLALDEAGVTDGELLSFALRAKQRLQDARMADGTKGARWDAPTEYKSWEAGWISMATCHLAARLGLHDEDVRTALTKYGNKRG